MTDIDEVRKRLFGFLDRARDDDACAIHRVCRVLGDESFGYVSWDGAVDALGITDIQSLAIASGWDSERLGRRQQWGGQFRHPRTQMSVPDEEFEANPFVALGREAFRLYGV